MTTIDFATALEQNPAMVARCNGIFDTEALATLAEEMEYDVDVEEFLDLVRSKQRGSGELGETELYAVAGGSGRSGVTYGYVCGAINSFMLKNNPWW